MLSAKQIRLVYIPHGIKDLNLNIRFTTVRLSEVPLFETLSYVWGVKHYYRVTCEGASLVVRRNLYDALHALRSTDETQIFWIDALCIDQQTLEERVQQVGMMCDIYAISQRTTVWLGAEDAVSSETITLLKKLANVPNSTEAEILFDEKDLVGQNSAPYALSPGSIGYGLFKKSLWLRALLSSSAPVEIWEWKVFATASRTALDRCKYWQTFFDPSRVVWLDGIRAEYIETVGVQRFFMPCPMGGALLHLLMLLWFMQCWASR
jgi:hypothetical protein